MLKTISLAAFAAFAATASAGATELALTFSGSDYQGGPAFEVRLGKTLVGTGVVDPIPATGQGYEYSFVLPDGPVDASRQLSIRMTNDAFKAHGEDRNLFLLAASIDGTQIPLTSFALTRKGEPFTRKLIGGHLELWNNQEVASLPIGGETSGGSITTAAAPSADATSVAEVAPAPAVCTATTSVVGIQTTSKPLTTSQLAALNAIIAQAKDNSCGIVLKGYASQGGSDETNRKVSLARAKLVLDTLKKSGLSFTTESVEGVGATNQFGSDDASNQRVNVALAAPDKK